jgi:hypothetical protein
MVFVLRVAVVIFAKCVLAERNEAVKTALKMEDATKLLVDNLIAELAQLRRENAEMTMKAEMLAKEVKRLSPEALAPAPMMEEKVIQEHISESLEQSESKSETQSKELQSTGGPCPTYPAFSSCATACMLSTRQGMPCVCNTHFHGGGGTKSCPRVHMHAKDHISSPHLYCCGINTNDYNYVTAWAMSDVQAEGRQNCYKEKSSGIQQSTAYCPNSDHPDPCIRTYTGASMNCAANGNAP